MTERRSSGREHGGDLRAASDGVPLGNMPKRDLDIRHLRTLVTIVEVGGFRRAADALNISQPAISQHIRRLDALIGEPVFRANRGQSMVLSAIGEELLWHARGLVKANDDLVTGLAFQQRRRRLALGVCEALVGVIPGLIDRLKEHLRPPCLTIYTGSDAELSVQLNEGAVDVALKLGRPEKPTDHVIAEVACAWFGQRHLLESEQVPIAALAPRSGRLRRLAEDTLATATTPWRIVYEGISAEDVVRMVQLGFGVSLLFRTAEQLWDLPPVPSGLLPDAVYPLPVTLGTSARLTGELAHATRKAALDAVVEYALATART